MKHSVIFLLMLFSIGIASAQSMDPEIPTTHPTDSVGPVVIELEVTINAIRLLKISSDSLVTEHDKVFSKGSMVKIVSSNNAKITYYQLNQAPEQRYDQPFRLVGKGRNTLSVRSVNSQGRESSLKLSFRVIE